MDPVMLEIPPECREVFRMFAAAVVDKPDEFAQSFEILLRHSSEPMLRLLADSKPADLAYTMLCYLPAELRDQIAQYMADRPEMRDQVLTSVRQCQQVLKLSIQDRIAAGDKTVLSLVGKKAS